MSMSSLQGKSVLVVDDAEDVCLLARKILESDGASVFTAANVDEALQLAREKAPHLIITDLMMPVKSGFDYLEALRQDPLCKGVPVLVLSAKNDQGSVKKAVALGASDYILKPFRATLLLQKVRKALKLSSFRSRRLNAQENGKATLSIPIEILKMNETACQIESAVKLAQDESVRIKSDAFDKLGLSETLMRTSGSMGQFSTQGHYVNEISFIGIDHELAQKIRTKIGESR